MALVKKAKRKSPAVRGVRKSLPKQRARKPAVRKAKAVRSPEKATKAARPPAKKMAFKTFRRAEEKLIGSVAHYFPKIRVAVVNLKAPVAVGDRIKIKGYTTDFTQNVISLQIDHISLKQAKKGDSVGLLVESRVRRHDVVSRA